MSKSLLAILVLSVLGIYVSGILVTESATFAVSGEMGCVAGNTGCLQAAKNTYSKIGGTPIAVFGLGFYLTALFMSVVALFWRTQETGLRHTFFVGSLLSLLYSIFLGGVSVSNDFFCPYCAALYGINLGLFVTTFMSFPKTGSSKVSALLQLPKSSAFWSVALVYFLAIPSAQSFYMKEVSSERTRVASESDRKILSGNELAEEVLKKEDKKLAQETKPSDTNAQNEDIPKPTLHAFEMSNRPIRGEGSSPLTLVEFSDFECPYCKNFGLSLKRALTVAPGKFKYVFKHFPLDKKCNPSITSDFHQHACDAAYAMVCAGEQQKEWEMHDLIFENQKSLKKASFERFATELGLSMPTFKSCLNSPRARAIVAEDVREGIKADIQGTPSVYVNGFQMAPELDGDKLGKLLSTISEQMR